MAGSALGIVDRELAHAARHALACKALLESGGWSDEAMLRSDIGSGKLDGNGVLHQALLKPGVIRSYIYHPARVTAEERDSVWIKPA